jgi:putative transcriptional regulator
MTKFSAGKLLIASPLIVDPVFGRSVCLIVHHDANGAMGVLLNRPLQFGNAKLWSMLLSGSHEHQDPAKPKDFRPPDLKREVPKAKDLRTGVALSPSPAGESGVCSRPLVHFGGPLPGPVVALHGHKSLADAEAGVGVYLAAQRQHLEKLVRGNTGEAMRLIIGHAAWKGGDLEAEIAAGLWYLLPTTPDRVFAADDSMWTHLIMAGVGHSLASWVGVDDTNINPNLN